MSGSDKYFARAKALLKRGRSSPAAIGSDGTYVKGYTRSYLTCAVLVGVVCGTLIGGAIVALTIVAGYNLTPLTSAQKRGIDMINSAAGWSWIDHITADDVNKRLSMSKELAFIVDEIATLPNEKADFTPRWWQPWMKSERSLVGRNEAVTIIARWIASSSEAKKGELLTILRDMVNIHQSRFSAVVETLVRMPEEKRQQIVDNGFVPMPRDRVAQNIVKLAISMTPDKLIKTMSYIQKGCPATRCPPRETLDCPEPPAVECPELPQADYQDHRQCPQSIDDALGSFRMNKETALNLVKRISGMIGHQYEAAMECINNNSWAR